MKELTVIMLDYAGSLDFFLNLAKSDPKRDYKFITNSFYVHKKVKEYDCYLVKKNKVFDKDSPVPSLNCTREVGLSILSKKSASSFYLNTYNMLENLLNEKKNYKSINILVWNGSTIFGEVVRSIAKKYSVLIGFLEIANFPGKLFVDKYGVNARSSLFLVGLENLKNAKVNLSEFKSFKEAFVKNKLSTVTQIPQAKKGKSLNVYHFIDFLFQISLGYRTFSLQSVMNKIGGRFTKAKSFNDTLPSVYTFLPLQVSSDTQLILNSDFTNESAIEYLMEASEYPVVVKPHPAEQDYTYLNDLKVRFKDKLFITQENTYLLLSEAESVYTINSTVGLEAMLFDKKVTFLGKSFFKNFNECDVAAYLLSYLINIDFFDTSKLVDKNNIEGLYARLK